MTPSFLTVGNGYASITKYGADCDGCEIMSDPCDHSFRFVGVELKYVLDHPEFAKTSFQQGQFSKWETAKSHMGGGAGLTFLLPNTELWVICLTSSMVFSFIVFQNVAHLWSYYAQFERSDMKTSLYIITGAINK